VGADKARASGDEGAFGCGHYVNVIEEACRTVMRLVTFGVKLRIALAR
jgi:hypothetical protein